MLKLQYIEVPSQPLTSLNYANYVHRDDDEEGQRDLKGGGGEEGRVDLGVRAFALHQ